MRRPVPSGTSDDQLGSKSYKPALGYRFLTRFYDPIVRWTTSEPSFREILLAQVEPARGACVLDLGCGTGTFALALQQRRPDLSIVGLDADIGVLTIARRKGDMANSAILWQHGNAVRMPFAGGAFDVVTCSLFFHHLLPAAKVRVAHEIWRVLKPNGSLHVADWTTPRQLRCSLGFLLVQLLDGFATTGEHRRGRLPSRLAEAGFVDIEASSSLDAPLGTIGFWRARRMAESNPVGPGGVP